MTEPTIDELLAWVSVMEQEWTRTYLPDPDEPAELNDPHRHAKAIRAILEQHRPYEPDKEPTIYQVMAYLDSTVQPKINAILAEEKHAVALAAIRAFVERVAKRIAEIPPYSERDTSREAMLSELAAMEQETK